MAAARAAVDRGRQRAAPSIAVGAPGRLARGPPAGVASLEMEDSPGSGRMRFRDVLAADLLGPVYRRFTEGLDTPDLTEARTLLDQLG